LGDICRVLTTAKKILAGVSGLDIFNTQTEHRATP